MRYLPFQFISISLVAFVGDSLALLILIRRGGTNPSFIFFPTTMAHSEAVEAGDIRLPGNGSPVCYLLKRRHHYRLRGTFIKSFAQFGRCSNAIRSGGLVPG
jgi:hypothetical protein